jgi:astacin (peptidase family M12A)/FG-GAP repeat protein
MTKLAFLCSCLIAAGCAGDMTPVGSKEEAAVERSSFRWELPIDYECDSDVDCSSTGIIQQALDDYAARTHISFHHGVTVGRPHIQYVNKATGSSTTDPVDPVTGTTIHLAPGFGMRIALHETGHALGLEHEQMRSDRDDHVSYDETCTQAPSQFTTNSNKTFGPYDILSIMEYGSDSECLRVTPPALGIGGTDCVCFPLVLPGYAHDSMDGYFAKSPELSIEDVNALWHMYGPKLGTNEQGDELGASTAAGDFDGDGYDDLAVGAPGEAPGIPQKTGVVFVYKGTYEGLVPWALLAESDFAGVTLSDYDDFGQSLAATDLDGDGIADLVVGAPGSKGLHTVAAGALYVYHGDSTYGLAPLTAYDMASLLLGTPAAGDRFGAAIATGDVDGDGHRDVVVGAPYRVTSSASAGYVYALKGDGLGHLSFFSGKSESPLATPTNGDLFGNNLAVGDVDADGKDDVIVGAAGQNVSRGAIFVLRGGTSGLSSSAMITEPGGAMVGHQFGSGVAAGDFDGHLVGSVPRKLIAVGAPNTSTSGRAYVLELHYSGSTYLGINRYQPLDQTMVGWMNNTSDLFGKVLVAGDLTNDGMDDLVVGVAGKETHGLTDNGAIEIFKGVPYSLSGSTFLIGWQAVGEPQSGQTNNADGFGGAAAVGHFLGATYYPAAGVAVGASGLTLGTLSSAGAVFQLQGTVSAPPTTLAGLLYEETQLSE